MAPDVDTQTTARTVSRAVPTRVSTERLLWGMVVLLMGFDVLTTGAGLSQGFAEGNPVMAAAIEQAGLAGLVLTKALVVAFGLAARIALPRHRYAIPLGLLTPSALAVLVNASLLL